MKKTSREQLMEILKKPRSVPKSEISMRQELWGVLHDGKGPTGHAFHFLSVLSILTSVALIPLEFTPVFYDHRETFFILEIIISGLFTADFLLKLWAAPSRIGYILSFYGFIDLLSILPFYLSLVPQAYTPYLRALRAIRLFRLFSTPASGQIDELTEEEEGMTLLPDEKIIHVVTKHPLYLLIVCTPTIAAFSVTVLLALYLPLTATTFSILGALGLGTFLFFWRAWLDYNYDVLFVTSHRLIYQNMHLLGRSINQMNYTTVTNIKPSTPSPIGFFLGYGTLVIETASAEVGLITMTMVRRHEEAADRIMGEALRVGNSK